MVTSPLPARAVSWDTKPVLRIVYSDLFRRMAAACVPGNTLEVGGGTGLGKEFLDDVVSSDVLYSDQLDLVADCHDLPFADASFDNIVMLDVLHHLDSPVLFLREAARVLRNGGRLVMIEPAITPLSLPFYKLLHHEPADMRVDPFGEHRVNAGKDPFDGNQAIPALMFRRAPQRTARLVPTLHVIADRTISLWSYPLSGGFKPWSLLPAGLAPALLRLEQAVEPLLGRLCGFRMLTVLEKRALTDSDDGRPQ